jgi:catechol 2,3-dioxygenase-like lactoylglutathione lyase family enzyme
VPQSAAVIGHLGVNVPDIAAARRYYDVLMPALDFEVFFARDEEVSYRPAGGKPGTYLFFYPSQEESGYSRHRTGLQHIAFMLPARARVHAVHVLVVSLGSEVIHPPQEFPQYHPGYYATFWYDPHGFMLEAVCHRDQV